MGALSRFDSIRCVFQTNAPMNVVAVADHKICNDFNETNWIYITLRLTISQIMVYSDISYSFDYLYLSIDLY